MTVATNEKTLNASSSFNGGMTITLLNTTPSIEDSFKANQLLIALKHEIVRMENFIKGCIGESEYLNYLHSIKFYFSKQDVVVPDLQDFISTMSSGEEGTFEGFLSFDRKGFEKYKFGLMELLNDEQLNVLRNEKNLNFAPLQYTE